MNGNSRETALMELSKKREQVPELALIIWHSFGEISSREIQTRDRADCEIRCHGVSIAGDYFGLSATESFAAYCGGVEQGLQCFGFIAMCGFS